MGVFDWFGDRKAAKELGLTVDQYREFKEFEASDNLTLKEYRAYLNEAAGQIGLREYLNRQKQQKTAPVKQTVHKAAFEKQPAAKSPEKDAITLPCKHIITKDDVPAEAKPMVIPEGVCEIDSFAFYESPCTAITIPRSVKQIGEYAFANSNLQKATINEGITEIDEYVFSTCLSLKSVSLPDSLLVVGSHAFYRCEAMDHIRLPEHLQSIGNGAFSFCKALKRIDIPDSVVMLDELAFLASDNINEISIPAHLKDALPPYFPCKIRNGSVNGYGSSASHSQSAASYAAPAKVGAVSAPAKSGTAAPAKAGTASAPDKSSAAAPAKTGTAPSAKKKDTANTAVSGTSSSVRAVSDQSRVVLDKSLNQQVSATDSYRYDGCWDMNIPAGCQVVETEGGWELRSAGETVFSIERSGKPTSFKGGKTLVMRDDDQMNVRVHIPAFYARNVLTASVTADQKNYSVQMKWKAGEIEEDEAAFRYELFMRTMGSAKLPGEDYTNGYRFEQKHSLLSNIQVALPVETKIGKGKEVINDGRIRVIVTEGAIAKTEEKAGAVSAAYHRTVLEHLSDSAWTEAHCAYMDCSKYLLADAEQEKKRLLIVTDPQANRQVMLCVESIDPACRHEKDAAFFAKCMYESIVLTPETNNPVCPASIVPVRLSTYPAERIQEKMYHLLQAARDKRITELDNGVTVQSFSMRSDIDLQCAPIRRVLVENTTTLQMTDEQWEQARMMGLAQEDDLPYMASARRYTEVFRVNRDVFDFRHDHENEILEGYIESIVDLHALCSFAYVMDYARRVDPDVVKSIACIADYAQVASKEWNGMPWSYAPGLCNAPDCYVAYVREQHIQKVSGNGWTYVSLEALQRDLAALQPVMEIIHDSLTADRDRSEALGDPLSDLLYAWCTLALASKEPFVILEGPTHCSFKWLGDPEVSTRQPGTAEQFYEMESRHLVRQLGMSEETRQMGTKSVSAAIKVGLAMQDPEAAEYARAHLDEDAVVSFAGKHFVLSGYEDNMEGEEAQQIKAHGGILHSKMVKSADYLVVRLETCGRSKLNKALEWREKGSRVQIISDEMLKEALY